jgi:hypothetical protein
LGPQKRNEILNFNQFLNLFRIIGPTWTYWKNEF